MSENKTGFYAADILLPRDADMEKWAVVACDQFTSQPEYWEETEKNVGDAPSTLRIILPEVYLEQDNVEERIVSINQTMEQYLREDIFTTNQDALIYVEREQSDGTIRHGIVGMIDLDDYEFKPGNNALIRATEGTVLERIPPRVKVRENAPVELPHVMLLIDDPDMTVISPLTKMAQVEPDRMNKVYDFTLQQGGGAIRGFLLNEAQKQAVMQSLEALATTEEMERKYGMKNAAPMLFAVGDGNHSLATAKRCYELMKEKTPKDQWAHLPSRFALVEVVNNHDDALKFEPIHRILFGVDKDDLMGALAEYYPNVYVEDRTDDAPFQADGHVIRMVDADSDAYVVVPDPSMQLEVGTIQVFLDEYLKDHPEVTIDYVHGDETTVEIGKRPGNVGILLPGMGKDQLFKTVIADGVLPRKTFSMGHAQDKRYYIEARKIK